HSRRLPSFPTRRSSDLDSALAELAGYILALAGAFVVPVALMATYLHFSRRLAEPPHGQGDWRFLCLSLGVGVFLLFLVRCYTRRSEEHTSELQSRVDLV